MSEELWRQHNYKSCMYCNGVWVDASEGVSSLIKPSSVEPSSRYDCPDCVEVNLQHGAIDDHSVEFCNTCKGVFLDKSEIEAVFPNLSSMDKAAAKKDIKNAFWSVYYFSRRVRSVISLFKLFSRK